MKFTVIFLLAFALIANAKTRYDNHKLVRLTFSHENQAKLIGEWESNDGEFDLWNVEKTALKYADVHLSPSAFKKYLPLFELNDIKYDILRDNIQKVVDEEDRIWTRSNFLTRANIINKFATYAEILSFVDQIVLENPTIASSYIAGNRTLENRELKVIVLKTASSKKPVWIDCGIHAREWVSHPTCIYMIDTLVNEHKTNPVTSLLNIYEFHILPLLNPDGYEFSRTSTRLWRKNRRVNAGSTCMGVDLNRNYAYQWMANGGASSSPCSETFAGATPASETETKAVESAITARDGEWFAFFTIHSYGQWWLLCFGDTKNKPSDYTEMERVGLAGVAAIASETNDKTKFVAGQSSVLLYINSGTSQDWAKGKMGIKYSYTLELRPGQNSADAGYGFQLPENRLPNLTKETYAGIKAALAAIPTA